MRFLPSLTPLQFILTKNEKQLRFICPATKTDDFDLKIHHCIFHIKRVKVYPGQLDLIENKLANSEPAKYYIKNEYCRSFPIDKGTTEQRISDILLTSYLPSGGIMVAFIEKKDLAGHRNASGFNFQLFDIESLYLKSGTQVFPKTGIYKPDIKDTLEKSNFYREYFSLIGHAPGLSLKSDNNIWISPDDFYSGFAIFKFSFSRLGEGYIESESFMDQRQPISTVDLFCKFKKPVPEPIAVVVFTSYLEMFSIRRTDRSLRDVELNYSL